LRDFDDFSTQSPREQAARVADIIQTLLDQGEFLLIIDDGGVYTEDGDYQPHIRELLQNVNGRGLPAIGFIQTRMMPTRFKETDPRSLHVYIPTLSDESARQLLGLVLKQLDVDYTDDQIEAASELIDGHPFNVRFAAVFAHDYGLEMLLADPSDLIEWKRKRAEYFLQNMTFSGIEADILAALGEYRYLATEMILSIPQAPMKDVASALRRLQEFSCVERREGYCHIAPPLRDAIRRDQRFGRSDAWKQNIGKVICDAISEYRNDDEVSVAILDGGALAAARGHKAPAFLSSLILPSHLLRIAREYYDAGKRGLCIEFCERAWAAKNRLPVEAQLEVLRLWGLSTVRIGNEEGFRKVLTLFRDYTGRTAERLLLFLEGFYLRVHNKLDEAEEKFLAAWRLSRDNQSVNRELANLLAKERRYDEAERFARGVYEQAPTNPFILDVMAEVLLGKFEQGLHVDQQEIKRVMRELERYGDAPGSSFYLVRKAQSELTDRKYEAALATIERAVERTPGLVNAYFIRAEAKIALSDPIGAEQDISEIQRLLTAAGGFSEGDEARLHELQIRILIEKRLLRQAKDQVDRSAWLPRKVSVRLLTQIARAISFDPSGVDETMQKWASRWQQPKLSLRSHRRGTSR
jgi:tetratricopeptide (TPR) repeat protein